MTDQIVDISGNRFWLTFFFALVILTPISNGRLRAYFISIVNVLFLKFLLFRSQLIFLIAVIVVVHLLIRFTANGPWRRMLAVGFGAATLILFLIHKGSILSQSSATQPLAATLTAIGFSFVALRIADLLRAVFENRHPPPDLPSSINYLFPFHMLAAGPIQSYDDFIAQPQLPAPLVLSQSLSAAEHIAWGLFKKFVLANAIQGLFLTGFTASGWYFLLEIQLFYIWLYLDFSGISEVALGIGSLLGIATPVNFDKPYLARNMINFWERWHISLSLFIRRNIYIPIQLWLVRRNDGRHPLWCSTIAFTVAFALCGLWHAPTFRFLLWGLWHAAGLVIANLYRHYLSRRIGAQGVKTYLKDKRIRLIATLLTFEYVAVSLLIIGLPMENFWQ